MFPYLYHPIWVLLALWRSRLLIANTKNHEWRAGYGVSVHAADKYGFSSSIPRHFQLAPAVSNARTQLHSLVYFSLLLTRCLPTRHITTLTTNSSVVSSIFWRRTMSK